MLIAWESFLSWLQLPEVGMAGVGIAAFVAATLLPLASEVVLLAYAALHPEHLVAVWSVATAGNTLGGLTTYAMGRYGASWIRSEPDERWRGYAEKYGPPLTALGWLPLAGDGLVLAAGLLRLNFVACTLWQALGRGLRYAAVLGMFRMFFS